MHLKQIIKVDLHDAWLSLIRHWFRSLLSTLGIAIGVASLVTMLSISGGAKNKAMERAVSLGVDKIRIENSQEKKILTDTTLANISYGIQENDLKAIRTQLSNKGIVGGYIKQDDIVFSTQQKQEISTMLRADPKWIKVENLQIQKGRYWTQLDQEQKQRVCVAGSNIAVKLGVKVGDFINYQDSYCKLIGIQKVKGRLLTEGTGLSTIDFDSSIMMPIFAISSDSIIGGQIAFDGITAKFKNVDDAKLQEFEEQITQLLLTRHNNVEDFQVIVPKKIMQQVRQEQKVFSIIMGGIAGLSLLVGGVGIMNIMLANVAEQVREIGLRIALGATAKRIVLLYVATSVLLSVIGAILGVIIGVILSILIMTVVDWPISFSFISMLLGPFFAIIAGVVFGIYPGISAISYDPATSLKEY